MRHSNYSMWIEINNKSVREYFHDGQYFIEGREGSPFIIKLKNDTSSKIKAIISVDGISIIDGNPAGEKSQGYVISPLSTETFVGWRTSETTVNEFYFSNKRKSYVNRTDANPANIGVIGAMIFSEEQRNYYSYATPTIGTYPVYSTTGFPYNASDVYTGTRGISTIATSSANIGTGFGNEVQSNSYQDYYSIFRTNPDEILCVYYDDRQGLEKRGIIVDPTKSYPNAFPEYSKTNKFVKRPMK